MGKERPLAADNFTLKPEDVFCSKSGYILGEYGTALQAIIVRQHVITSGCDSPRRIIEIKQEIAKICTKHGIPEEALPFLKNIFNLAVEQQERRVQGNVPNTQGRALART